MALFGVAPAGGQDVDSSGLDFARVEAEVVWDALNQTSGNYLTGVQPEFSVRYRRAVVTLQPNESVQFRVPAHEMIRVVACDHSSAGAGVQIWTSNGSGLYRRIQSVISSNGRSIIAVPNADDESVASVMRPKNCDGPITVAIYTSRRSAPRLLDYYRCQLLNCADDVIVTEGASKKERRYNDVPAGTSRAVQVQGANRLRFEARMLYDQVYDRDQAFWIGVLVDGHLRRVLSFETSPRTEIRKYVNGCEKLVGRREFAYLDLDCGNQLVEIVSSHAVLLRIDGVGLELCGPNKNKLVKDSEAGGGPPISVWDAVDSFVSTHFSALDSMAGPRVMYSDFASSTEFWNPYLNQQLIQCVARDNAIQQGGLHAYMWMRAIAARHFDEANGGSTGLATSSYRDEISVSDLARRLRAHTFFRDLLPIQIREEHDLTYAALVDNRLRPRDSSARETIVGELHIPEVVNAIPQSRFLRLRNGQPLTYRPPEQLGTSVLRISVDHADIAKNAHLRVRYDDRPPIDLSLDRACGLPDDATAPTTAALALSCLVNKHSMFESGTLGGPFAMRNRSSEMLQVGTAEIIKPAGVKRVEVSLVSSTAKGIRIAVQILMSKESKLTESSFDGLQELRKWADFRGELGAALGRFVNRELENDSFRTQQSLTALHDEFEASVVRSDQLLPSADQWSQAKIAEVRQQIVTFTRQGQWVSVVELLSGLVNHTVGELRREAILARVEALENSGEYFLADRERRGWFAFSEDPELRSEMRKQLLVSYSEQEHATEVVQVAAGLSGSEENLLDLSRTLMAHGKYRSALAILPDLEPNAANVEILLRCSFQIQWWNLFDKAVASLDDPERRNLWNALREMHFGEYANAEQLLQQSGEVGRLWLEQFLSGVRLFNDLSSSDRSVRLAAIEAWENWWDVSPGWKRWVEAQDAVVASAGVADVRTLLGARMQFYRADPQEPGTLLVHGPAKIRIECRPLHAKGSEASIDDWLVIEGQEQFQSLPISSNYASKGLTIAEESDLVPGQLMTTDIELLPGLNRIQVRAERVPLLFRVSVLQSEIKLPLLPEINRSTVRAVVDGSLARRQSACTCPIADEESGAQDCLRIVCDGQCHSLPLRYRVTCNGCNASTETADEIVDQLLDYAPTILTRLRPQQQPFLIPAIDPVYQNAITLVRNSPDELVSTFSDQPQPTKPVQASRAAVVYLQDLINQNPRHRLLRELQTFVMRGSTWNVYSQFDSRAGVFTQDFVGWHPETPGLRIRRSLMAESTWDAEIVTGSRSLSIGLADEGQSSVVLSLSRAGLGFLPLGEIEAEYSDNGVLEPVVIAEEQIIEARVTPGLRAVDIRHVVPLANHYIVARVKERTRDGSLVLAPGYGSKERAASRSYQVATPDEPLRFRVVGPTLIRVDKLVGEHTTTEIIPVLDDQQITLGSDAEQTAYRIFELDWDSESLPTYRRPQQTPQTLADWPNDVVKALFEQAEVCADSDAVHMASLRSPDLAPLLVELDDLTLLGRQELGTWALAGGYQERRPVEELQDVAAPGRFFEFSLARYLHRSKRDWYSKNELIFRPRLDSGPTFGFQHSGYRLLQDQSDCASCDDQIGWQPFALQWNGFAYSQRAGQPLLPGANSDPWTVGFSTSISRRHEINDNMRHQPRVSVFGRLLSEDQNGFGPGELDQDIFTPYKSDHPFGVVFSDMFVYQTCLDRRWWIRPRLASNSNEWIPDNLGFQVGTDRIIGPVQLKLSYRMTGYFADQDRSRASVQNVVYLDVKYENWRNRDLRSETAFFMRNDLNDGTASIGFSFTSFWNHARLYRDFSPADMLFRPVREQRAAKHFWSDN